MTEASIQDVYTVDEGREEPSTVLVLKAHGADGYLPIYVSVAPGQNIAVRLRGVNKDRPQTYGLMAELVEKLGGKVESVHIVDSRESVFYSLLRVSINGVTHEIDCRPSDALALAVQVNAPIFVASDLLCHVATPEAAMLMREKVKSIKPFELN